MNIEKQIHQTRPFHSEYEKLFVNLLYTGKIITQAAADHLKPYNISLQQYNILRILRGKHPGVTTVTAIRERMLDPMSDTSRIVDLLNRKGLVARQTNVENRRKTDVKITASGLELLQKIDAGNEQFFAILNTLTPQQAQQLNTLLDLSRTQIEQSLHQPGRVEQE